MGSWTTNPELKGSPAGALPAAALLLCLLLAPAAARAADTTEPFGRGAIDVEGHFTLDGVAGPRDARVLAGEVILGVGLARWLSLTGTLQLQSSWAADDQQAGGQVWLHATVLNTDHLDLDLTLEVGLAGGHLSDLRWAPGMELNLDRAPELGSLGLYLRAGLPMSVQQQDGDRLQLALETVLGAYVTLAPGHQVLLEFDLAFLPAAGDGEETVNPGGFALGYNVVAVDGLELLADVWIGPPWASNDLQIAVSVGFIMSLDPQG